MGRVVYHHGEPRWQAAIERVRRDRHLVLEREARDPTARARWLRRVKEASDQLNLIYLGRGMRVHVVLGPCDDDILTVCGRHSRNGDWMPARYDDMPSPCCLDADWGRWLIDGKVVACV